MSAAPKPRSATVRDDPNLEYAFEASEFRVIAETLYGAAGIVLAEHKMPLVYGRLVKRLRALGLSSFRDYCALIQDGRGGADERQQMIAALTTNVTRFMREGHHFEHLRAVVLPPLLKEAAKGKRVRIWSAACSSGQEPYSIALTLLSLMPNAGQHDVKILATDIDPNMIAAARAGSYPASELDEIGKADRLRWFAPDDARPDHMRVGEAMRRLVTFNELNLIGAWPMKGTFQAIFCRNVVIYFDEATQGRIWSRFVELIDPAGHLYIGHSERLSGPAKSLFKQAGATIFQRTGTGA